MNRGLGPSLLLLAGFSAFASGGEAPAPPVETVIGRLQDYYRNTPGLVLDFTQTLDSPTLGRSQEEEGTLSLKPPGRMRWEYRRPPGKLAVTDGHRAFLYLPEDRQVLVGRLDDLDGGSIASQILSGTVTIASRFTVEREPAPDRPEVCRLKLLPKDQDFPYEAVTIEVEAATGAIRSIRLRDPLGNQMEYRFGPARPAPQLPEKTFTFKIPRGVDVQTLGEGSEARPSSP